MRLDKRFFESFLKGVKEWLPYYYDRIIDTATIDDVGYKLGFDKEPSYIFDFELSDEKLKELKNLSDSLHFYATKNKTFDEELYKKYDDLVGFIGIIDFYCKK